MSKREFERYKAGLRINKDDLDNELSQFPMAFFSVSDKFAEAERYAKRLSQRVDRERASITAALREAAVEEGEKPTETRLKQEASLHPRIVKLEGKLRSAHNHARRWEILKDAYVQMSFSLKGLVSLAMHENFQSSHANIDDSNVTRKRRGSGKE